MASEDVQTNLRLPATLKEQLVASAAKNNRSLSAEVSSLIQASLDGGVTQDLVLDQARQIWELRYRAASAYAALLSALALLEGHKDADKEIVLGLKQMLERNAQYLSPVMDEETIKAVSRISVDEEMQEVRRHLAKFIARKPKP
ncbi:Arc family DNA-binding protein [Delftia lacustris]|uniref:Arc family DNA-binding protein n=1 Tax=Delftia lacustris TaxID=558537 RepID=A0A7T2YMX8_9BURK|nr:Arc family DNA-binding protein [Delftia lacustris]QPS78629.1 Arc family DNA-binding protein [Delftia lacustris]